MCNTEYNRLIKEMKNKHAQALAKKRAESLTPERRKEIASKAAKIRWAKKLSTDKK